MKFTFKSLCCSALGLAGVFALLWLWPTKQLDHKRSKQWLDNIEHSASIADTNDFYLVGSDGDTPYCMDSDNVKWPARIGKDGWAISCYAADKGIPMPAKVTHETH